MDTFTKHELETQKILDEKFKRGEIKNLFIPEILDGINAIEDFDERVKTLRSNSERSLNTFLFFTFGAVELALTESDLREIEYRHNHLNDDFSIAGSTLYDQARRFYLFEAGKLPKLKLINILTEMLEYLHPDEGELLKCMFGRKFEKYPNITAELVKAAFPDLDVVVEDGNVKEPKTDPKPQEPDATKPKAEPKKPAAKKTRAPSAKSKVGAKKSSKKQTEDSTKGAQATTEPVSEGDK